VPWEGIQASQSNFRAAQVAGGDVDHPVRQLQGLEDLLLAGQQQLVLGGRRLGEHERHHLHLVELVDPEDAPGVLAVGPDLAAEAGREADVAQRQGAGVEQLVAVVGDQRDLGGAGQVQVVVGRAEDLLLVGGRKPVPNIASRRTSTGGTTGTNPAAVSRSTAKRTRASSSRAPGPVR
jgi:hypothetical protein